MKMIPDADIVWDKREQSRIEAQIKKQQELKLIGSMKKVPGHTLFSFNYKTGGINRTTRRRKGSIPSCRDSRPAIMILFLIPLFPDLLRYSRRQNPFSRER